MRSFGRDDECVPLPQLLSVEAVPLWTDFLGHRAERRCAERGGNVLTVLPDLRQEGARSAGCPESQGTMLHCQGYFSPGVPMRKGAGTDIGRWRAMIGSQCCSCSKRVALAARRGRRTAIVSPNRNIKLSHPTATSARGNSAKIRMLSSE